MRRCNAGLIDSGRQVDFSVNARSSPFPSLDFRELDSEKGLGLDKASIRKRLQAQVRAISASERARGAQRITQWLAKDPYFSGARSVSLFASFSDEIDTRAIHDLCVKLGKRVNYPRLVASESRLEFCEVLGDLDDELQAADGGKGVRAELREPGAACEVAAPKSIDLVLLPGLAFSPAGARLGRGLGYYDRTLAQKDFSHVQRYGVCFALQVLDELPEAAHDVRCHKVFTPERVYDAAGVHIKEGNQS